VKFPKYLALLALASLLIPASVLARDKNEHSVIISNPLEVGHIQLQPGTYKLEWQNSGANTQVTFLHGKKVVTTTPATVKPNDSAVRQDDVITDQAAGNRQTLREIDFSHGKEAVIFHKGA
jgi:hypothetical protein